jgi:plasmid stabilization system protein ParE
VYQIKITEPAERDIQDAAKYISVELRNKIAAVRLLDDLDEAIYSLVEMPSRYALVDDAVLAGQGVRFFPVHSYLVLYTIREKTKTVVIERFIYCRRDWISILRGKDE